jgi:hypothetical protein
VLTSRTSATVREGNTVRRLETSETVTLHYTLEPFPDPTIASASRLPFAALGPLPDQHSRSRGHIDVLPRHKVPRPNLRSHRQDSVLCHPKLLHAVFWRDTSFEEVPEEGPGGGAFGAVGGAKLEGVQRGGRGGGGVPYDLA